VSAGAVPRTIFPACDVIVELKIRYSPEIRFPVEVAPEGMVAALPAMFPALHTLESPSPRDEHPMKLLACVVVSVDPVDGVVVLPVPVPSASICPVPPETSNTSIALYGSAVTPPLKLTVIMFPVAETTDGANQVMTQANVAPQDMVDITPVAPLPAPTGVIVKAARGRPNPPVPALPTLKDVTAPPDSDAVMVGSSENPPPDEATVGFVVYPLPPAVTRAACACPGVDEEGGTAK
jgi:hypothetical protein